MNRLALQHRRHFQHIKQRRVGAGTNTNLIHLGTGNMLHADHVIRAMGASDHGLQSGQIHGNDPVIFRVCIAEKLYVVFFSALGLQKALCCFIGGENRGGSTKFCTHIGNGGPLRNGQCLYTGAAPLNNGTYAALDGQDPQQFQTHILSGDVGIQLAGQLYLEQFRHCNIIRAAAHSHRHVQSACAKGQHTDAAAGRGMAVRADERLARLAEPLQMDLVADAVARTGEIHAVLGSNRLQIPVIVGVFKAGLKGVVIHISNTQFRLNPVDSHSFQFQIGHGAGGILGQSLIDPKRNLTAGRHIPFYQMRRNDLLRYGHAHIIFLPAYTS